MAGIAEGALRVTLWINMAALLIAAGAGLFLLVVWRRSATAPRPSPVEATFIRRWRRVVISAWTVGMASSLALVPWADNVFREWTRLGLVLLGGVVWFAVLRRQLAIDRDVFRFVPAESGAFEPGSMSRWPRALGALAVLGLLASVALTGHARGSSLPFPNLTVALVHVAAAAAWVGGLVALVGMALPAVRGQEAAVKAAILAPVVARFSDLALVSVVLIVATGTYSAWIGIRELGALTGSTYGRVFLVKLSAFLPALALGAINNQWTKPKLLRAARRNVSASSPLRLIRRLVALEIGLLAVVLGLTAFLVHIVPPSRAGTP